jgi:hypothetical protein
VRYLAAGAALFAGERFSPIERQLVEPDCDFGVSSGHIHRFFRIGRKVEELGGGAVSIHEQLPLSIAYRDVGAAMSRLFWLRKRPFVTAVFPI